MTTYKAPLQRHAVCDAGPAQHRESTTSRLPDCEEVNQELIDAILGEASKFSEDIDRPAQRRGRRGRLPRCWTGGEVKTPAGFKEAYEQYVDAGWPSLDQPSRYGGQDLPMSIGTDDS